MRKFLTTELMRKKSVGKLMKFPKTDGWGFDFGACGGFNEAWLFGNISLVFQNTF